MNLGFMVYISILGCGLGASFQMGVYVVRGCFHLVTWPQRRAYERRQRVNPW